MNQVNWNGAEVEMKVRKLGLEKLTKLTLAVERDAKRLCPVETGRLRASITNEIDAGKLEARVGTNTSYAPYVELGTSKMKAQPYLRPSLEMNREK